MTDDDKKEVERMLRSWAYSDEMQQIMRKIIKHVDTEKYLERSERWLDRLPFVFIGLGAGLIIMTILRH